MDGMDGLAGIMTVIGFFGLGIVAMNESSFSIALISFSTVVSVIPFLLFNFHPARIFMGDCGSVPLGFLSVAIGFYGWLEQLWSFFFPVILFAPFLADATFTILRRLLKKKNIFKPHQEHYYQRLVKYGYSVKKVWLGFTFAMVLCTIIGVSTYKKTLTFQALVFTVLFLFFCITAVCLEKLVKIRNYRVSCEKN